MYRTGELAKMVGVTVRTLHHYDSLGLVRPADHTEGGHRVYSGDALLRLQQVIALRHMGFSLEQARGLLESPEFDIEVSLKAQRKAITGRIEELERLRDAISGLLEERSATGKWSIRLAALAARLILQSDKDRGEKMKTLYTEEQMAQFEKLGREVPEETRKEIERKWAELMAEVQAGLGLNPVSAEAQALVRRWDALTEELQGFYAKYPDLWKAIGGNYEAGNFDNQPGAPGRDVFAFIEKAREARA